MFESSWTRANEVSKGQTVRGTVWDSKLFSDDFEAEGEQNYTERVLKRYASNPRGPASVEKSTLCWVFFYIGRTGYF